MTYEQAKEAVQVGIDCVKELSEKGYKIIVTGEMGIGNTTTSSAVASVLLDRKSRGRNRQRCRTDKRCIGEKN